MEELEQIKEGFVVKDLSSATWVLRQLKKIYNAEQEIEKLADEEIDKIVKWQDKELEALQWSKNKFNVMLTDYYRKQKQINDKYKLSTPYGKVTSRKMQDKWIYDDDKILKWLKVNNANLIRVKTTEEIDKNEFKIAYKVQNGKVITEDGEVVDGVTVEEQDISITIKVEEE